MEQKELINLIEKFDNSTLSKLNYEEKGVKLSLEKNSVNDCCGIDNTVKVSNTTISENTTRIKSPLVGVFYSVPSPDSEPFVKEGQEIKKGDVVGLVEAMKMINEIKSTVDGKINKINVSNGQVVSFDEVLFEVSIC